MSFEDIFFITLMVLMLITLPFTTGLIITWKDKFMEDADKKPAE